MRDNTLAIDTLHSQLLLLSRDPKYGIEPLRCEWGKYGSQEYGMRMSQFRRGMRELAKDSPVKWYRGSYYLFNGKVYEPAQDEIIEMAYQMLIEDLSIVPLLNRPGGLSEVFFKTVRLYNVLVPHFDIVAFDNGVVDFGTGAKEPLLMPFSPEYHVTYYHPYRYDPSAKCNRWLNFIHEVLPDRTSRMILQMFLGLGLVQRGTAYNVYEGRESGKVELCLLLVGAGANGKSVVFDVACQLFGPDRISKMDYGDLTAEGDEGMRGRFPIRNAIFNWSSDSDPRKFGRKNTGMFKRLVSGEPVPMRELGRNVLEANAIPYLIFNLNELPFPDDASLGFIRRLQYVSFDVSISADRQDPELASKIIRHELSGVFNWVFRGMQELKKRRYRFPAAEGSRKQLLKSLLGSQPILAWIRAYGLRSEPEAKNETGLWFTASQLYDCLAMFCRDNNLDEGDIPTRQRFGRVMWDKCNFVRKRRPDGMTYMVYGLQEPDLHEHVLIDDVPSCGEEDDEPDSFIKDDD